MGIIYTTNLRLRKSSDGADRLKRSLDFNRNWDVVDSKLGTPINKWIPYPIRWISILDPQPFLGSGILMGRYLLFGRLVFVSIILRIEAGTTFGTNAWEFTLPFRPVLTNFLSNYENEGIFTAFDSSVSGFFALGSIVESGLGTVRPAVNGSIGVTGTTPFTWFAGDRLTGSLVYQRTDTEQKELP